MNTLSPPWTEENKKENLKELLSQYLEYVKEHFPEPRQHVYFIPRVYCNRVQYRQEQIAGKTVLVRQEDAAGRTVPERRGKKATANSLRDSGFEPPPTYLESDFRDDEAQGWFCRCLKALGAALTEGMVVISNLNFKNYLVNCELDPNNAALLDLFPKLWQDHGGVRRDGEIDALIIHPNFGVIVVEIKSVGSWLKDDVQASVAKRLKKAVNQLNRAKTSLKGLFENDPLIEDLSNVCVTATLVLPNLKRDELVQILHADQDLAKELRQCLGSADIMETVDKCLCGGDSPDSPRRSEVANKRGNTDTDHKASFFRQICRFVREALEPPSQDRQQPEEQCMKMLRAWWQKTVVEPQKDKTSHVDCYDQLLARFCGPATTVTVPTMTKHRQSMKTIGETVAHTGLTMTTYLLVPKQMELLTKEDAENRYVYLYGPPGTGKTVCLILKGAQWRCQGHNVYVISVGQEGVVVSMQIEKQIATMTDPEAAGKLQRYRFNFRTRADVDAAVDTLFHAAASAASTFGDEEGTVAGPSPGESGKFTRNPSAHIIVDEITPYQSALFNEFFKRLETHVADLHIWAASIHTPRELPEEITSEIMTYPLRCTPAVQQEVSQSEYMGNLSSDSITLSYSMGRGPTYTAGVNVVWLHHACYSGHAFDYPVNCEECGSTIANYLLDDLKVQQDLTEDDKGKLQLRFKDIFILCNEPSEESGMVRSLRQRGIPLQVMNSDSEFDIKKDAALAKSNKVIITDYVSASGLERSVVIGMGLNMGDFLVHGMGKLSQPRNLFLISLILIAGCLITEICLNVKNLDPESVFTKTVFGFACLIGLGLLSVYLASKLIGNLHISLIVLVCACLFIIMVEALIFGEQISGLITFALMSLFGGFLECKLNNIFPVLAGILAGRYFLGDAGEILGSIIAVLLFNRSANNTHKIYRGIAFGLSYTCRKYANNGIFIPLSMNGFWASVVTNTLINIILDINKFETGDSLQIIAFTAAAIYTLWSVLHEQPCVVILLMVAGIIVGVAYGATMESLQVKKSKDRLHCMSRSSSLLLWFDKPIPRVQCL